MRAFCLAARRTNAVMTGLVPVIHVVELPPFFSSAGNGAAAPLPASLGRFLGLGDVDARDKPHMR